MRLSLVLVLCAFLIPGIPLFSETLLDQQPPTTPDGADVSDGNCSIATAENFRLESAAELTRVVVWGTYEGDPTPGTDDFAILVHRDDTGLPGTILESEFGIVPTERAETGLTVFGDPVYQFTLDLPNPPDLEPGIWWIEVFNNTDDPLFCYAWLSGLADAASEPGNAVAFSTPGTAWTLRSWNMAVQVMGNSFETAIFRDDFESGDTTIWSSTVP